ncbi:MAG: hypothetical protein LBC84_03090 [Prevotellaceae bacterium]|jgi:hypothetical protein|nr:hypothetical protein [Prevotellaceae bacterium]
MMSNIFKTNREATKNTEKTQEGSRKKTDNATRDFGPDNPPPPPPRKPTGQDKDNV